MSISSNEVHLGDLAMLYDSLHKTPKAYVEDGYPMVRVTDVKRGNLQTAGTMQVDEKTYDEFSKKHKPQIGNIVLTRVGSYGNSAIVADEKPFCLGQNTVCISPNREQIHPYYLYCCLNSRFVQAQFDSFITGSSQPTISLKNIRAVRIPLPRIEVQRRVSEILTAYDELIENNRRRIQLLEESARLLYKEWFVHLRFPGHEHTTITDGVPEGWERKTIADMATVYRGKSYKSSELRESNAKPFVNLKCIQRYGGYRSSGLKYFEGECKEHHHVYGGDIVMAVTDMTRERMIVARAGLIPGDIGDKAVYSMDLVKIIPSVHETKHWFYWMLRHSSFADEVKECATGVNVLHLKPKYIEQWTGVMPPQELQHQFEKHAYPLVTQQELLNRQIAAAESARDLLLPRLMSGEVAV